MEYEEIGNHHIKSGHIGIPKMKRNPNLNCETQYNYSYCVL